MEGVRRNKAAGSVGVLIARDVCDVLRNGRIQSGSCIGYRGSLGKRRDEDVKEASKTSE